MKSFPGCEKEKTDKQIVLQETKSKITFLNPNSIKVRKIRVDGCVIQDNESLRCDYLLILSLDNQEIEIYVELKGSDVKHAVEQLESTIKTLSDNFQKKKKLCFVVSTRVPRQGTDIQGIQTRFKKNFNASFRVKSGQDTYDLGA